jgi:hypothetical protein
VRIAISSSSFRRPLALRELTQLEWVERCASVLEADGIVAAVDDFPRVDGEYVAQLRKVTIDLGLVPFGLDAPALLDPTAAPGSLQDVLALANAFGAAIVRTVLPVPGEVPPASFVEAVAAAKEASRAAKAANVTLVVAAAPGTLGEDVGGVKHLLKDVDSAWLRACPAALTDPSAISARDRFPALAATTADDPSGVASAARSAWVIVDAPDAAQPLDELAAYVGALRDAQAEGRLSKALTRRE